MNSIPSNARRLLIQCNDIAIDDVAVIPVVYRTLAHARVDKLRHRLGGWDSQFWALADWFREA